MKEEEEEEAFLRSAAQLEAAEAEEAAAEDEAKGKSGLREPPRPERPKD